MSSTDPSGELAALLDELSAAEAASDPRLRAELEERVTSLFAKIRKAMRFDCALSAQLRIEGRPQGAVVRNISAGGLLVQTAAVVVQGAFLEIAVVDDGVPLSGAWLKGSVAWVQPGTSIGVAFDSMDLETLARLQLYLLARATESLPPDSN